MMQPLQLMTLEPSLLTQLVKQLSPLKQQLTHWHQKHNLMLA
jgi:hypothetical protein